jgi:fatty acid desaturase
MSPVDVIALSRKDDAATRSGLFAGVDRWLACWLYQPEDAFVVRHLARLMALCCFAAYANFVFSWWYVPIVYVGIVTNGETIGRFMHIVSHRRLFRPPLGWLNTAPTWVASPWFGEPPFLFGAEHVPNHHAHDNGPQDLGSTRLYQRDSWAALGRYLMAFFVGGAGPFGLAARFRQGRGGRVWRRRFFLGQALFWGIVVVRLWFDWVATLALLVGPYIFVQAVNRANNWAEHAFINPECPDDPLGNAFTIVDSDFNRGVGFNEGYHTAHHLKPGLPNHLWPRYFRDHLDRYCAADHLVFRGLSTNDLFFRLMFKDYRFLARHLVQLPGRSRTQDELADLLRQRVQPIGSCQRR